MATLRHILCAALILLFVLNSTHALSLSYYPTQLNSTALSLSLSRPTTQLRHSAHTHTHTGNELCPCSVNGSYPNADTIPTIPYSPYPQPTSIRSCLVYACVCVCLLRLPFHLTATPCLRSLQPALTLCLSPTLPLCLSPILPLSLLHCLFVISAPPL